MTGNNRNKEGKAALQAAVEAVEGAVKPLVTEITLDNGVVLKLKPVPPFAAQHAVANLEEPKPPIVDVGKGKDREEENPNDPGYLEKMEAYSREVIETTVNAMLVTGTEIISVPDGVQSPEDDDWLNRIQYLGIEVDGENKWARYVAWLRYCALSGPSLTRIMAELRKSIGLNEEEVDIAVKTFRNRAERRADKRVSPEAPGDGDNVPEGAARGGARGRGKRSR